MNLTTLNTWGGRAGKEKLLPFFEAHKDTMDIFCLQEIWAAPYEHLEGALAGGMNIEHDQIMTEGMQEISLLLNEHTSYFHPHFLDNYGLMMSVKKNLIITGQGDVFVYKHKGYVPDGDVGGHAPLLLEFSVGQ